MARSKPEPNADDIAEEAESARLAEIAHGFGFQQNYPFSEAAASGAGPTCSECGCWIQPGGHPCPHCVTCVA